MAQLVKNPPAVWETWVRSLGWEDPLEEGMETHCSILAWKIPMDRGAWKVTVHGVTHRVRHHWATKNSPYIYGKLSRFAISLKLTLYCKSTMKVKVTQSCPTLCNPMNHIVHGILQARILECVAFPFSRGSSQARDRTQVSHMAGRFFTSWATTILQ